MSLDEDVEVLRRACSDIIEADMSGDTVAFEGLGKHYGLIARRVFFSMKNKHPVFLDPWTVANRAWKCGHCDVGSFDFWTSGEMVIAMCGFLDSIKARGEENASTARA